MPESAAYVGRPTRWGNPYRIEHRTTSAHRTAVAMFEDYLKRHPELIQAACVELAGCDLACWCPLDLPCHADVWLRAANDSEETP